MGSDIFLLSRQMFTGTFVMSIIGGQIVIMCIQQTKKFPFSDSHHPMHFVKIKLQCYICAQVNNLIMTFTNQDLRVKQIASHTHFTKIKKKHRPQID